MSDSPLDRLLDLLERVDTTLTQVEAAQSEESDEGNADRIEQAWIALDNLATIANDIVP